MTVFIQIEETPNPNSLKFISPVQISDEPLYFKSMDDSNPELVQLILSIDGVYAVFFGSDFISVTKDDDVQWEVLKPDILMIIIDYIASGKDIVNFNKNTQNTSADAGVGVDLDDEIVKQIKEVIELYVRPSVSLDGGDIAFVSFDKESGAVMLEMRGACAGCPSSSATLKHGVENILRHYVPEVAFVEAC